jgi:DNA-binding transcriptional ArsR family regulator
MGKTGDTKKQIIDILQTKSGTLTDISEKLDLAPSTVSQHLKELVSAGQIRLADDKPRKWKYYELNRGQVASPYARGFQMKSMYMPIGGIALIAILAIGLYLTGSGGVAVAQQVYIAPGSAVPNGSTVFTLSDSPQYYNISAVFVTVTNASVRSTAGKWYRIPLQQRTFNLVDLRNISEIMSGVNLSVGSYDAIVLSASNVSAIVNGTSKSVFLPSGKLVVLGEFNITSNSTNWINIDFDLQRSLHITSNGSIVMLPVLFIRHDTGSDIDLNASSIIVARGTPPQSHEAFECGMDINGSMSGNFTFPQNVIIGFSGGRPMMMAGNVPSPLFLRLKRGIIIGSDGKTFLANNGWNSNASANWSGSESGPFGEAAVAYNVSANSTNVICPLAGGCRGPMMPPMEIWSNSSEGSNASASWQGNGSQTGGWAIVRLPPGFASGNASGYANCNITSNGGVVCEQNVSINATAGPIGRTVIVGGSCAGLRPGEC